jgi:hypothetical protein
VTSFFPVGVLKPPVTALRPWEIVIDIKNCIQGLNKSQLPKLRWEDIKDIWQFVL